MTIQAACKMQLEHYPLDEQHCPLILSSCESLAKTFDTHHVAFLSERVCIMHWQWLEV